ncbi:MAG: hypothetical protein WD426_07890 [Anditalea sp.]
MNLKNTMLIILLSTFTLAVNNSFAQTDSPRERKILKELDQQERYEERKESQINKNRQKDANALKKEFKAKAKEAKRISKEASNASKQANKSAKMEKKAQKSRIKATKQKEKSDKANRKSDLN